MKKLTLDIDQLAVETFATDLDKAGPRGTVRGQSGETTTNVPGCWTDPGQMSCDNRTACDMTCDPWNGWCNHSQGGPNHTACDFSCEFACPVTAIGC